MLQNWVKKDKRIFMRSVSIPMEESVEHLLSLSLVIYMLASAEIL